MPHERKFSAICIFYVHSSEFSDTLCLIIFKSSLNYGLGMHKFMYYQHTACIFRLKTWLMFLNASQNIQCNKATAGSFGCNSFWMSNSPKKGAYQDRSRLSQPHSAKNNPPGLYSSQLLWASVFLLSFLSRSLLTLCSH